MSGNGSLAPATLLIHTQAGDLKVDIYDTADRALIPAVDRPHAAPTECRSKLCVLTIPKSWAAYHPARPH